MQTFTFWLKVVLRTQSCFLSHHGCWREMTRCSRNRATHPGSARGLRAQVLASKSITYLGLARRRARHWAASRRGIAQRARSTMMVVLYVPCAKDRLEPKIEDVGSDTSWDCSACTFHNDGGATCAMCGRPLEVQIEEVKERSKTEAYERWPMPNPVATSIGLPSDPD